MRTIFAVEVGGGRLREGIYLRPGGGFGMGLEKAHRFATYMDADRTADELSDKHPQLLFWAAAEPLGDQ